MIEALAYALIGAFSNCFIRGGFWKQFFRDVKIGGGLDDDIPNALLFGGTAWFASGSAWIGIAFAVGMFVGSAPGWKDYVSLMIERRIAGLILMTARGGFWGLCVAAALLLYDPDARQWPFIVAVFLAGCTLGIIFWTLIRLIGWRSNRFNYWMMSEVVFGAVFWSTLALL